MTNNYLTCSNMNKVHVSGLNVTIEANRNNRHSLLRFGDNSKRKKSYNRHLVSLFDCHFACFV